MNVKWVIQTTHLSERKVELIDIISKYGDTTIEVKPFEVPDIDNSSPVMSLCALTTARDILRETNAYPGVYCNLYNFKCSSYYPYYNKYLLNSPYCMMPYGDIINHKEFLFNSLGNNDSLFIRPDSGFKQFTGQVVNKETFERDINSLESIKPQDNLLCLLSSPINIKQEWRLIIADKKIVGVSEYGWNDGYKEGCSDKCRSFAEEILDNVGWEPERCFSMDICETKSGDVRLIELNSFSCSGLYECNLDSVISSVREVVIQDWEDMYIG